MAKSNKYNEKDPSIRGASRKSEMDLKKILHKRSGGRPARLKALLEAENEAELERLRKEAEAVAKAKAEAEKKTSAKKPKSEATKPKAEEKKQE